MTVIKPNSVAGINSITVQSGNSLAIHKSNGELLRTITGTTGVTTFSSISVGTAYTDNSAAKSINIGVGASISQHNANTLSLGTGGDERVLLNANGFLGIGTATVAAPFQVYDATNNTIARLDSGDATCRLQLVDSAGMGFVAVSGDDLILANTSSITERLRITSTGNINVSTAATIKANGNATFSGIVTATSFKGDGSGLSGISAGTSLSGSTNNTVTTVTGANAIQGEAGLTYNGTRLDVTTGDLQVIGGEGGDAEIRIVADQGDDGADYWRFQSNASNNNLNIATFASGSWEDKVSLTSTNVLMGGTTSYDNFENSSTSPRLQVRGTNLNGSCQAWIRATADAGAPKLFIANTRSTAEGGHTVVQNGDEIGQIHFAGSDGTQFVDGCQIRGAIDDTPGADDMPGRLTFHTTPNGSASCAERMRLDKSGNLLIATTLSGTNSGASGISIGSDSAIVVRRNGVHQYYQSLDTGSYTSNVFMSANTAVGSITFNSGGTQFNTSSDYRRKENVVGITSAITRLKTLIPKRFNFKSDTSRTVDGFLAHEVTAVPEAITGTKDQVAIADDVTSGIATAVGDPIYQQIDQSKLVPLLTAALQEAVTKIETLETKVAALEGG